MFIHFFITEIKASQKRKTNSKIPRFKKPFYFFFLKADYGDFTNIWDRKNILKKRKDEKENLKSEIRNKFPKLKKSCFK